MKYGSLAKGTIYSCRAHIATSFVPATRVIGKETLGEIWRFWEIKPVESGSTSFGLVIISSCIVARGSFLGRSCTDGHTRGFCEGGPHSAWVIECFACTSAQM
jgi:hypothetical protein